MDTKLKLWCDKTQGLPPINCSGILYMFLKNPYPALTDVLGFEYDFFKLY